MAIADGINTGQIAEGGIVVGDLADGALAASVAGRLKMATGFFDVAAVLDKFAANSFTNANLLSLVLDGAFQADAATRALFGAGIWNTASLSAGVLSADVAGRALTAASYFDTATVLDKFAAGSLTSANLTALIPDDALTNAILLDLVQDGAFAATAATRALFAALFVNDAMINDVAAAKVTGQVAIANGGTASATAAAARTALGLAIATDVQAFDATLTSIAALGTVADRIVYTTGIDTWAEATLAAGGRNLIALAAGSLTADATGRALFAAGIFNAATVDSAFGTGSIGEDRLTASEVDARPLAQIADTAVTATATAGADVVMKLVVEDVPTGNQDFVLPADIGACQVVDCWGIKRNGAGGAGDTHQLQTGIGGAMSNAMVSNIAEDAIVRCGSLDEAASLLASGATLRVAVVDGAAGNTSLDVFVRVIKRA